MEYKKMFEIQNMLGASIVSKPLESLAYEQLYHQHISAFEGLLHAVDNRMLPSCKLFELQGQEGCRLDGQCAQAETFIVHTLVYDTFDYPETLHNASLHFPLVYGIGRMDILYTKCKRFDARNMEPFDEMCRWALINNITLVFHEDDNLQPRMRKQMTECGVRWIEVVSSLRNQEKRQGVSLVVSASPLSVGKKDVTSFLRQVSTLLLSAITHS